MFKRKKTVFLFCLLTGLFIFITPRPYGQEDFMDEMRLFVNKPEIFRTNVPKRIVIGNPQVVEVSSVTEKEIDVLPKTQGVTTFVFWDAEGEHSFRLRVIAEDLSEVKIRIDAILKELNYPKINTRVVETGEKLLLMGSVTTEKEKEQLTRALEDILKEKSSRIINLIEVKEQNVVVEIEAEILELDADVSKTIGFTMPTSISMAEPTGAYPLSVGRGAAKALFHVFSWPRSALFTAKIDALVQEGKARILSKPRLACQSGKEAELLIGGEKPTFSTQVASAGGTGADVSYKQYGIKMKVKPTVMENDRINVALNVDISEVGAAETIGTTSTGQTTALAYPTSKRNVATELLLENGQTLSIAGLIKQKDEVDINKTAFLGDIPIVGALFRKRTTKSGGGFGERGNIELVILLTPKIVAKYTDDEDANKQNVQIKSSEGQTTAPKVGPLVEYSELVKKYIMDNFIYPPFAKESGLKGACRLSVHLGPSGELLDVVVKSSTGNKGLTDYAISEVRRLHSYPPFLSSMEQKELWIDVPIVYQAEE